MKEKISLIQMDVELGQMERNYEKAVQLMELALEDKPDILVPAGNGKHRFLSVAGQRTLCLF